MNAPIVLAEKGCPNLRIALNGNPSDAESYAAEELRRHLETIIGSPVRRGRFASSGIPVLYINDGAAAGQAGIDVPQLGLTPESFHLETAGGNLHILGGGPRGVLYGVYEFLETLGCRWFTPEISRIPRLKRIALPPLRKTGHPAFEMRDMSPWENQDPDWWVRNRLNGMYTSLPDYMGGNTRYSSLFVHTFYILVPPDEFFATHPEYYAFDGQTHRHEHRQLCLSNPDVLRIVVERLLDRMRLEPKATLFSVSQNDCWGYCECPACRAIVAEDGAQSGPLLRFVNAVAEATARVFPDKLIDTLAYMYTLDAPKKGKVHPNVRIRLCSIGCCTGHGYGTCDHPESLRFLRALQAWKQLTPQIYIWHYCTDFPHYVLPVADLDELHDNLLLYRQYGVYGIYMQGGGEAGGGAESMALRGYVLGRLFWNPDQPVWPLVDEFLGAYYGAAAPNVRRYLDLFHQRLRDDRTIHPTHGTPPTSPLFAGDLPGRAQAALTEGAARVRGAERQRVRLLQASVRYAQLFHDVGVFALKDNVYRGKATPKDAADFEAMVRLWRSAGIRTIKEWTPFDLTVHKLRNLVTPHPVEWLKEGDQSLAIIPTLGGRIQEWHAHGRQWLAQPDPAIQSWRVVYPMMEGYMEFAIQSHFAPDAWCVPFRSRRTRTGVMLTARLTDSARLTRSFQLRKGVLKIVSNLKNCGAAPYRVAWQGIWSLALRDATGAFLGNGETDDRRQSWQEGKELKFVLEGDRLQAGGWSVEGQGYRLAHRFDPERLELAILYAPADRSKLTLELKTATVELKPGDELNMVQEMQIAST